MKIKVIKNIYTGEMEEKSFKKMLRKIQLKRPVMGIYVITQPIENHGLLEIYNYNELLQPYYRNKKGTVLVVGVASSREAAAQVVADMMEDMMQQLGRIDVNEYLGVS